MLISSLVHHSASSLLGILTPILSPDISPLSFPGMFQALDSLHQMSRPSDASMPTAAMPATQTPGIRPTSVPWEWTEDCIVVYLDQAISLMVRTPNCSRRNSLRLTSGSRRFGTSYRKSHAMPSTATGSIFLCMMAQEIEGPAHASTGLRPKG